MSTATNRSANGRGSRKIVTPLTRALSLVIGVFGAMLFFHFEEGLVKGVHEWLGMAFVVVMLVHLAMNWKAFKQHFRKPAAWVGTGAVTAISAMFLVSSLAQPNESPVRSIIHSIETTAVYDLAPVFKVSHLEMSKKLDQAGVVIITGQETIEELADSSGVDARKLIATLAKK
jgi:uncharacterized protein YidB (DUF937 family)